MKTFVLALTCVLIVAPSVGQASDSDSFHGITVTGDCLAKVTQDRGAITVTSSVKAADAKKAAQDAIARHERAKADIDGLKLKDASKQTLALTLVEDCEYVGNGQRTCTGYRATLATRFETSDIPRLGDVIATALKTESQEVSGLETFVSPSKNKEAREACLETATRNAFSKAQKLAQGAGVTLGKLVSLSEDVQTGPIGVPFERRLSNARSMAAADAAPSIDSQAEDLRVTVSALYAIN